MKKLTLFIALALFALQASAQQATVIAHRVMALDSIYVDGVWIKKANVDAWNAGGPGVKYVDTLFIRGDSLIYQKNGAEFQLKVGAGADSAIYATVHKLDSTRAALTAQIPTATSQLDNDAGFLSSVTWSIITGKPDLSGYLTKIVEPTNGSIVIANSDGTVSGTSTKLSDFSGVAFSGDYSDLINQPMIPTNTNQLTNGSGFLSSVTWSIITGKPTFSAVATTGAYSDLTGKPTIPTDLSQLGNDAGYLTADSLADHAYDVKAPLSVNPVTKEMTVDTGRGAHSVATQHQVDSLGGLIGASSGTTNLSVGTKTSTTMAINSSTGTGATLPSATTSQAGLQSAADKTKLDGIAAGADANPSNMPQAEAEAGTATTQRTITAAVLKAAIDALAPSGGSGTDSIIQPIAPITAARNGDTIKIGLNTSDYLTIQFPDDSVDLSSITGASPLDSVLKKGDSSGRSIIVGSAIVHGNTHITGITQFDGFAQFGGSSAGVDGASISGFGNGIFSALQTPVLTVNGNAETETTTISNVKNANQLGTDGDGKIVAKTGVTRTIRVVTGNTTITTADYTIICDGSTAGSQITWTLPTPSSCNGQIFHIVNWNTSAAGVDGSIALTEDIYQGSASSASSIGHGNAWIIQSDGSKYWLIQSNALFQ